MQKQKMLYTLFLCAAICFIMDACVKNNTTFKGRVYWGIKKGEQIEIKGPCSGAFITCKGYSNYTNSDNNGAYTLTLNTVRMFDWRNYDEYGLIVAWEQGSAEMSAYGKPGDTIYVKDFLIIRGTTTNENY
jgi:hypothetical protein